jgi:hypothetical protein
MHAGELTQLAATVVTHAPLLIHSGEPFPASAIERYWTASKCRQENWGRALKDFSIGQRESPQSATLVECGIQPILEEILTAEILTRVWAAVCALVDGRRGTKDTSTIALNILVGHLEARNRVLNLMVYGYGMRVEDAVTLNRLRIRNELWSDTLLSLLGPAAAQPDWSVQPERVRQLALSFRQHEAAAGIEFARSAVVTALVAAYQRTTSHSTPHVDLNRHIASSIVACFPPHVFDGTGRLPSIQQLWLLRSSSDNQGHLLTHNSPPSPRSDRWK